MHELIRKHYSSIKFRLYLRHKTTGFYIGADCYVRCASKGLYVTVDAEGASIREVYDTICESAKWLRKVNISEFEIQSEVDF